MAKVLKNGLVYLHIPKTGGNWLTDILERQDLITGEIGHKHATYDALISECLPEAGTLPVRLTGYFCVVRHPLRWYESWFKYQTARGWKTWGKAGKPHRWHVMTEMNRNKAVDFNDFMQLVNRNTPGFVHQLYGSYTNGSNAVILKNEPIAQDFTALCERSRLGIDQKAVLSAPPLGVSPRMEISWDRDVLRETIENEAPAFKRYGYERP